MNQYAAFQVDPSAYRNKIEMVTAGIRQAILFGHIKAGEKLSSEDICTIYNVSRSPVREALRRLESDGLVEIVPQQYILVRGIDVCEFNNLSQLRASWEAFALDLLIKRVTPELLQPLKEIAQEDLPALQSIQAYEVAIRFHRKMVELSGNKELLYYYEKMMERYQRFLHLNYKPIQTIKPYHAEMVVAIENGGFESAKDILKVDLAECEDHIRVFLEDMEQ